MIDRGLTKIGKIDTFDSAVNVAQIKAGAPVGSYFDNATQKVVATTKAEGSTAAKFLGFAFNDHMNPTEVKTKIEEGIFKAVTVSTTDYAAADATNFQDIFDSSTTMVEFYALDASGVRTNLVKVEAIADVAEGKYFMDATTKTLITEKGLVGAQFHAKYQVKMSGSEAAMHNQFGANIFTPTVNTISVITEAQTVAVDSHYVLADDYAGSATMAEAPKCFLTKDTEGEFVIKVGGSTGDEIKNTMFLGFEGSWAMFKVSAQG